MKQSIKTITFKTNWMIFLMLSFIIVFSCKEYEDKNVSQFPSGKWKVIQLKSPQKLILFDSTKAYFLEYNTKDRIIITAEDNMLSGELMVVNNDSIKMKNLEMTDICCNSEDGNLLFRFFYGTLKYKENGNKLTLSSNGMDVTFEKQKIK